MRTILALALLLTGSAATQPQPKAEQQARLVWEAVPLDVARPDRRRIGGLIYLGGWTLRSRDPRFGGISAIHVDGREVTAISDKGALIRFSFSGSSASIGELAKGDSESLVVDNGRAWIGFERTNSVASYRWPGFEKAGSAAPAGIRGWPNNGGPEAMLRLPDGRFLIFSESGRRPDGSTEVLLFDRDPTLPAVKAVSLGYRPPKGFVVTDAAWLPDGRMLLLNRRYAGLEGISAKLIVARLSSLQAGTVIVGQEIADFRPPVTIGNKEALAVTREGERTIVWIASDDNFSPLQRTLLMKFALAD